MIDLYCSQYLQFGGHINFGRTRFFLPIIIIGDRMLLAARFLTFVAPLEGSRSFLVGLRKDKKLLREIIVFFPTYFVHLLLHVLHPLLEEHLGGHLGDELLLQPPDRVVLHQAGKRAINLELLILMNWDVGG